MQPDAVTAGVFDAADVQHLRAAGCQLEHLLAGHEIDLLSPRHHARISCEHTVDVCVDLAHFSVEGGSQRDCSGVGASAAERRDVSADLVEARKARDDCDSTLVDGVFDAAGCDADDLGLTVLSVGEHAGLAAGE